MDLCNINVVANNKETDLTNVQDILSVFEKIKNGHVDHEIQQIRNANDKAHKNKLKGLLPPLRYQLLSMIGAKKTK